jgi:hypothetical protein
MRGPRIEDQTAAPRENGGEIPKEVDDRVVEIDTAPLERNFLWTKRNHILGRFDVTSAVSVLLLAQLAADFGKGLPQIRSHAIRISKRRIKNGLHLASLLML